MSLDVLSIDCQNRRECDGTILNENSSLKRSELFEAKTVRLTPVRLSECAHWMDCCSQALTLEMPTVNFDFMHQAIIRDAKAAVAESYR